jgi:hypothetical protein
MSPARESSRDYSKFSKVPSLISLPKGDGNIRSRLLSRSIPPIFFSSEAALSKDWKK